MQRSSPGPSEEDGSFDCPLCMEEMDPTDRHFKPCPCGYQVCRFCWNRIRQNENQKCPACRRIYTDEGVEFTPLSPEELAVLQQRASGRKNKEKMHTARKEFQDDDDAPVLPSRRHLVDVRVTQRNLVYVIGIPISLADESILRQDDYFGRYGRILKMVINRKAYVRTTGSGAISNAAAYITYSKDEEALKAIKQVDGKMIDGAKLLRATYGTTKYCAHFLRGRQCPKMGCLYLHHEVPASETFTGEHPSFSTPSVSPPASPMHTAANVVPSSTTDDAMESERTRSFFERLQRWSRMDEILADISPESSLGTPAVLQTTFNPWEDEERAGTEYVVRALINEAIEESSASAVKKPLSVNDLFGKSVEKVSEPLIGKSTPEQSTERTIKRTDSTKTEPSKTEHLRIEPPKDLLKITETKKRTTPPSPQFSRKTDKDGKGEKDVKTIDSKAPKALRQPSSPVLPKKSQLVANDNLFNVLMTGEPDDYIPPEEASDSDAISDQPASSQQQPQQQKKAVKRGKKGKEEDELDVLLREVEAQKAAAKQSEKQIEKQPELVKQEKPSEPVKQEKRSIEKSTLKKEQNVLISQMEEEAARRVMELEEVLRASRLEAREVEERLRESLKVFLGSMQIDHEEYESSDKNNQ